MSNRDLLLKALRGEKTERVPWVPFVGVHGGSLLGIDATHYLKSPDQMVQALMLAAERYRPDGLPVVFDLQLEAEILGCDLAWAEQTPPSVASHPLDEDYDLDALPDFSVEKGRMPLVLDTVRRCQAMLGETVALYGLLTGPLTLALHLRGDDLLLDLFDEEDGVVRLLDFCAGIAKKMAAAYIEAGVDVIAVVDPMISQISPAHFNQFVAPPLNTLFDTIREASSLSSLFVCGNATRNIEAMCATRCDNISVDENVDLRLLAEICRRHGKSFGGNLQLTVVLLLGEPRDAMRDAVRCLDQAGADEGGFVLAPGCDLPYLVKPENLEAVAEVVHNPYQLEIARQLPEKTETDPFDDIPIPDYATEPEVVVDVVTLDSAGCAPCAYMVKAAQEAARHFDKPCRVVEHKITGRDGLGYMTKLQVSAIPSICVDGRESFASIIPKREDLIRSLETAWKTK